MPAKRARLLVRGFRRAALWAHERPFLATFLALSVWLTILSSVVWIANNHRISDNTQRIAEIQELRRDRARLGAESDFKLCVGLNQLKAAIRAVVIDNEQTKARLGLPKKPHVTPGTLRRIARRDGPRAAYARALLSFVRRFPPEGCGTLPTQRPFH